MERSRPTSGRPRHPGRFQSERPADFNRNRWPTSIGMPGRHHRNPHAGDRSLEIFGEAAVSIESSEGSFDDPSPREQLKPGRVSGAFDDLDGPVAEFSEDLTQVGAVIDAVGEEMAKPGKQLVDGLDDKPGTIAILDIGGVHLGTDQQTGSIGHNVTLTAPGLLGRVPRVAALPRPRTGSATRPTALGRLD